MAWHTTKEASSTVQKCAKYPTEEGFSTILVGGYSTFLSHKARNEWMEYVRDLKEYLDYSTAEQRLLSIQYQQNGNPVDLSWAMVARERAFFNAEKTMYAIAKNWVNPKITPIDSSDTDFDLFDSHVPVNP